MNYSDKVRLFQMSRTRQGWFL